MVSRRDACGDGAPRAADGRAIGLRVRVIAIDGFDARILDELAASGARAGTCGAFEGARHRLGVGRRHADTDDPARVWTTIATGQPPDVHGVEGLETRRVAGVQGSVAIGWPVTLAPRDSRRDRSRSPDAAVDRERQRAAGENVLGGCGRAPACAQRSSTGGQPGPPLRTAGIVLSDRATLRLERGGPARCRDRAGNTLRQLRQQWPEIKSSAPNARSRAPPTSTAGEAARTILRRSAELDAHAARAAVPCRDARDGSVGGLPAGPRHRSARAARRPTVALAPSALGPRSRR